MLKSPAEIFEAISHLGIQKGTASLRKLCALAFIAGLFLSLGGLVSAVGASRVSVSMEGDAISVSHFANYFTYAALFPMGLILIFCCGAELFTGNNLYLIISCFNKTITIKQVLRNWSIVWVFNFLGSIFAIFVFARFSGVVASDSLPAAFIQNLAETKISLSFVEIFFRGIGSNFLICAGSWMAIGSQDIFSRGFSIWLAAFIFVFNGFEHSIANMFSLPLGYIVGGDFPLWKVFYQIIVTTVGNIVGGAFIVGLVYWLAFSEAPKQSTQTENDEEMVDKKNEPIV
ncbi:hypothetical protein GEMRC1_003465 [Eukaryota sp. GEM-RC1]